jgi:Spy/CpxP family protein refolding chaperone
MKNLLRTAALSMAASLALAGLAFPQDTSQQPAPSPQTAPNPGLRRGRWHHKGGNEDTRLERLSRQLNLTNDQKTKLKPILHNEWQEMKPIHDDTSLSQDQKREKMKSIHEKYRSDIAGVLTPEQQEKWKNMQEHRMKHHGRKQAPQS